MLNANCGLSFHTDNQQYEISPMYDELPVTAAQLHVAPRTIG